MRFSHSSKEYRCDVGEQEGTEEAKLVEVLTKPRERPGVTAELRRF